jgi:hypothetical protein
MRAVLRSPRTVRVMAIKTVSLSLAAIAALAISGCAGLAPAGPAPAPAPTNSAKVQKAPDATSKPKKMQVGTPKKPRTTATVKHQAVILPDGKSDAYIKKIDTRKRTVTFDLIIFLQDPERMKRWLKDNPGQTDGPENDYLIQNDNPKLRTMPVTAGARIRTIAFTPEKGKSPSHVLTLDRLAKTFRDSGLPYTLTVRNGKIIGIAEIYLP